tara:strand:+ start:736 stop:1980 length:1245 start_codon:yes stop_codon:yes gene_type:complete
MSGSASRASKYAKMVINKDGKTANIAGKTTSFDFYESVYSPEITATLVFLDSGDSIEADKEQDTQERKGSIKNSLPITGYEDLEVKIESKSGILNFTKNPLKINSAPVVSQESNRQSVLLSLKSNPAIDNYDIKDPCKKYKGRISNTVEQILKDLNIKKYTIDGTSNSYDFISKGKGGLDLINDLCRRSIPEKGDPGFFFYETQDGLNFKAIDNLISEEPVETYTYSGAMQGKENDFKIVLPPNIVKDQDVSKTLESGTYSSRNVFFNPLTFETKEDIYKLNPEKTLGKKEVPFKDKVDNYSKTNYHILDIGSLDPTNTTPNNDPREWQAKSPMRYNLLHSQIMEIQVPCNLKLRAGNIIKVEFERQGDKAMGGVDQQQSGKYLILHLCHHFDPQRSFTSMTLARDSYGLHTGK